MRLRLLLPLLAAVATLSACGNSGEESPSAPAASVTADSNPNQTVPGGQTETATSTTPTTATTAQAPTSSGAAGAEPNAGDEEAIRVPAQYDLSGGRLTPGTVSVPAYLRIELVVRNRDGAARSVSFRGKTLHVPAGATRSTFVDGLRPGRYPVTSDDGAKATLVSGAEPGP